MMYVWANFIFTYYAYAVQKIPAFMRNNQNF